MLKFPFVSKDITQPLPKMSLLDYARFSEHCLRSNRSITPQNCMTKRTDEATMQPFLMPARHKT